MRTENSLSVFEQTEKHWPILGIVSNHDYTFPVLQKESNIEIVSSNNDLTETYNENSTDSNYVSHFSPFR